MISETSYPHIFYQTHRKMAAILLVSIAVLVSGCEQKADSEHKPNIPAPVLPTADRLADEQFLAQINETNGGLIGIVRELRKIDYRPAPVKDEFETSQQYAARRGKFEHRPPYGSKFYALVQDADYSYDADSNVAFFFYNFTGGHEDQAFPNDENGILQVENLHIDVVGERPPEHPNVKMSIEEARKLPHRKLRIALMLSFEGLHPPVLSSEQNWLYDPAAMDDLDGSTLLSDEARWNRAYDIFKQIALHLRAHIVRVIVFDAADGGAEHPLFQWTAPQN